MLCAGIALTVPAEDAELATDAMSDDALRALRDQKVKQLAERARHLPRQHANGASYAGIFFCTIYYTPVETGFTAERGFDVTPVSAPGLRGRSYPRDFLLAVKKEGFGRITEPVNDCRYLRWMSDNRYAFAEMPLGRRGEVLVPRHSCAISSRNKFLRQHDRLVIASPLVQSETGSEEWIVTDTGPAVHPLQIDVYWGDDEPRGAVGRQRARPRGTAMEYAFTTEVTVKN